MKPSSGCGKHAHASWKHWENGWEALGISTDYKMQLHREPLWQQEIPLVLGATGSPWHGGHPPRVIPQWNGLDVEGCACHSVPCFLWPYEQDDTSSTEDEE